MDNVKMEPDEDPNMMEIREMVEAQEAQEYIAGLEEQQPSDGGVVQMVDNCISTQTPNFEDPGFVEVETFVVSATKRSVQTQTDPRLKRKKFGPLNHDAGIDAMDFDEIDEELNARRRKKPESDYGLFEEHEPRRKSIRRNTEEALKCPFCEKAFIGLVKHIKGKHRDE